jgi:pyruvate-formate lyase-activating enzyme
MNVFDPLPEHRTLSVMPTFQCTAECAHCGTLSSPREKTRLPLADMLSAIDQATAGGYGVVVFTGGEPTLAGKDLLVAMERAASHGLVVRMVTNAYWALDEEVADRRMAEFVRAGLNEINFSTGDQHARFVPVERVIRATRAAAKLGLRVAIMVETVRERTVTRETLESHPEFQALRQDFPTASIKVHESPWMPLSPHAVHDYAEGITVNATNVSMRAGCDSVLHTTTVEADGRLGACCGLGMRLIPELQIGNVRDTPLSEADRRAREDFLKRWIRVEGPERILAWAATHDPSIQWEDMYAHRCQACIRLYTDPAVRRVIREHHEEKMVDVMCSELLLYQYRADEGDAGAQRSSVDGL